jgi:DNA mismatch repair ATPase MutL
VFHEWKVDVELMVNWVRASPPSPLLKGSDLFTLMLDEMVGMKACKASIKAGQKLSDLEMKQLVEDGFTHISGMFVCQHGRPSAVRIEKGNIDELFERH